MEQTPSSNEPYLIRALAETRQLLRYFDRSPKFTVETLGPVYSLYHQWKKKVLQESKSLEVKDELQRTQASDVINIALLNEVCHLNLSDIPYFAADQVIQAFPAELIDKGFLIPQTIEDVNQALCSWEALMYESCWENVATDYPSIANLHHPVQIGLNRNAFDYSKKWGDPRFLPNRFKLRQTTSSRVFSHLCVPDEYRNTNGARVLFTFLAPRYDKISDQEHKEKVGKILFRQPLLRSTLDIGCGKGLTKLWLEKWNRGNETTLYGVDVAENMVAAARQIGENAIVFDLTTSTTQQLKSAFGVNCFQQAFMAFVDFWLSPDEKQQLYNNVYELFRY